MRVRRAAPRRGARSSPARRVPMPGAARRGPASTPASRRGLDLARVRAAVEAHDRGRRGEPSASPSTGSPTPARRRRCWCPVRARRRDPRGADPARRPPAHPHRRGELPRGPARPRGDSRVRGAAARRPRRSGSTPTPVELVGRLTPLATFSSGTIITPVVGVLASAPRLHASPSEVEHVFDVTLAELAADGVFREERWVDPRSAHAGRERRRRRILPGVVLRASPTTPCGGPPPACSSSCCGSSWPFSG